MALAATTTWITNQILTSSALNSEFASIRNNALSLVSPWTGNMDAGGFRLITLAAGTVGDPAIRPTGDTNTGIYFSAADTIDLAAGGVRAASFGASFVLIAAPEDSRTDSVDVAGEIRSTTSGSPAAGIGTGLLFSAESADENPSNAGELDFVFTDVGAATEDSVLDILLRTAGAALGARYRFQATGAFRALLTHALTADRTITFPDEAGTLLTGAGHDVAAAVHGLPASVNVLGNRAAAGEFIQRGSLAVTSDSTDRSVFTNTNPGAITFAVAFSATPLVMLGTDYTGTDAFQAAAVRGISTTGMTLSVLSVGGANTALRAAYIALGT